MSVLLGTGLGGFCGAVARYYLGSLIMDRWKGSFPLSTYIINISGAFLLCFLAGLLQQGAVLSPVLNSTITTGILGAYTTFSTFACESVKLVEDSKWLTALGYTFGTIFCGFLAGWIGYMAGITIL